MTALSLQHNRTHFRGKARPGRRIDLTYCARGLDAAQTIATVTLNIGAGGAFIVSQAPLPVGTKLDLMVHIPTTPAPLVLIAEVRWLAAPGESEEPGMGVQFLNVGTDALLAMSAYFASLTGSDT